MQNSNTNSKVVLVTGASSGLGQAIATHLAARGHRVFGSSREPRGDAGPVRMLSLDVTRDESAAQAVANVLALTGRLDVLVNNAGVGLCGAIEDTAMDEARWQMETNFFGPARMIRAVLPQMRSQGSGRIITVSSLAGVAALPFQPYYSASKHALEGLNEALRLELAGSGIDATTIMPGDFRTGFTAARVFARNARSARNGERLAATMAICERDEKQGADPKLVAALAARLVEAQQVRVRYSVGRLDQRLGVLLKRVVPAGVFESLMKMTYGIR